VLAPRDTPTRECRSLDGLWRFVLDHGGEGRAGRWWAGLPAGAVEMPVPASYNDVLPDRAMREHVGEAWYERSFVCPRGWEGQRIVLRFGSATHRAEVWVNGVRVASHDGGYTPFEADVTGVVSCGAPNRVTVVVGNQLTWESIPPGYVEETAGGRRQRSFHDFFNYAGLHRSVLLYTTPAAHVKDITVVTGLSGSRGSVGYTVRTEGADGQPVRVVLRDADGLSVADGVGGAGELTVQDAHPWRPGAGYLYGLTVELHPAGGGEGRGDPIDTYTLPVGIRTVAVDGERFLINGEPFHFTGFGTHEDNPLRGKGHDDVAMVHDFALMLWAGANSLRTSHYPYAEEVMEYADRHGIVVIDETPAVGLNMGLGGDLSAGHGLVTFSPETIGDAAQAAHARVLDELITRDRNHPCVVAWSIANEPESETPAARAYFEPLVAQARRLDPSRPVAFANAATAPASADLITDLFDLVMVNRYYGWYEEIGDLATAEPALEAELRAWATKHGKPIIVTEYGADAVAGLHGAVPVPWTEEYQAELLDMYHRVFDRVDAVVGEHVWVFADFATPDGIKRVAGNRKGVFTRDRQPKAAAWLLRRRWAGGAAASQIGIVGQSATVASAAVLSRGPNESADPNAT
jgi:beta-glucuronidase